MYVFDIMQFIIIILILIVLMLISGLAGYFLNRHYNKKKYKNKKRLWHLVLTDSCFVLFKAFFYLLILFTVITINNRLSCYSRCANKASFYQIGYRFTF